MISTLFSQFTMKSKLKYNTPAVVMAHLAKTLYRHKSSILNLQNLSLSTKLGIPVSVMKILTNRGMLWEHWNNTIMNKVDDDRIRMVGPDRACAEWLLKCGGKVKWKDSSRWEKDYNFLPGGNFEKYHIEEIDASGSIVMCEGMIHLKGLKDINKIIFHECRYFEDESISYLMPIKDRLEHLQISRCGHVTERGLNLLVALKKLKTLKLFELYGVETPESCYKLLTKELPNCIIDYDAVTGSNQATKQQQNGG